MAKKGVKIIVVGGGLAGAMAAIKVAESGYDVDLVALLPVKRAHSVCAQGGINAALDTMGEGDSIWEHFDDTIYGGDFLANQELPYQMTKAAPGIIMMFDRMGVPFTRTSEGRLDARRFGGTKKRRTYFSGASTGQQLEYSLDEQLRRLEAGNIFGAGKLTKYEYFDFQSVVMDSNGVARGIIALNLKNMTLQIMKADAVLLATGGPGMIYGKSTNSIENHGTGAGAILAQGGYYANGEFIQIHPTAMIGDDKLRLMSESARGEGGRIWVPKDKFNKTAPEDIPEKDRDYFLERMYPAYGNLVPRDVASRAIFQVCVDENSGINGERKVYLDLTEKATGIPEERLRKRLGAIVEIYEKFAGDNPAKKPMIIYPGIHYSMGGIWIDYNHMTSIPGVFAAGEADYQYHGANRLGANSLLSATFGGLYAAPKIVEYVEKLPTLSSTTSDSIFQSELKRVESLYDGYKKSAGSENVFQIFDEMGEIMSTYVHIVRTEEGLKKAEVELQKLQERYKSIGLNDKKFGNYNLELQMSYHLGLMLNMARVITKGALLRKESRGSHFRRDFTERNDDEFLKTTKAKIGSNGEPIIEYEDVDIKYIKPRKRDYTKDK
ncbi:succinate dehydrogenase (quinone) flavoprotein subunit [bacterium]|nr:succinate dehydrogenase (quinone) flavoprotein subunit [bacterium]